MSDTQFTLQDYAHAVDEADTQIHTAELCLRCRGLGLSDGCPLCARFPPPCPDDDDRARPLHAEDRMSTIRSTLRLLVGALLLVVLGLLISACDIMGQPCGLLNTSACPPTTTPTLSIGDCGTLVPSLDTEVWICNVPSRYSDIDDIVAPGAPTCGLLECLSSTALAGEAEQEISAYLIGKFNLVAEGLVCKQWGDRLSAPHAVPVFTSDQCTDPSPAPCAMLQESCEQITCCKYPVAPFDLSCGGPAVDSESGGSLCCINEGNPCTENAQCCVSPEPGVQPDSICGSGMGDDADQTHIGVCCSPAGALCTLSEQGAQSTCCSGSCFYSATSFAPTEFGLCDSL